MDLPFDPFATRLRVFNRVGRSRPFFVDIDDGWISYGRVGKGEAVEKLDHFGDRADWPTLSDLRQFAEEFVCSLPAIEADM